MEQIAEDKAAQWHSNRAPIPDLDLDRLPKSPMTFIEPMQCQLVSKLPEGEDWEYEIKWDGYRALAIKDHGEVRIVSRRGNMLNSDFPELVKGCEALEDGLIVDGEIVALDSEGRPSFNL